MSKASTRQVPFGIKLTRAQAKIFGELLDERAPDAWPISDRRVACQLAIVLSAGENASHKQLRTMAMLRKILRGGAPTTQKDFRREERSKDRIAARASLTRFFEAHPMLAAPVDEQGWRELVDREVARAHRIGPPALEQEQEREDV